MSFGASMHELRVYQREGIHFLLERRQALLADEMGLGKTVQVASALRGLREARHLSRALIVAPSSLLPNWKRELEIWGPDVLVRTTSNLDSVDRKATYRLPIPIVVTSYETLRADFLVNPPQTLFDCVVFDEAQRLKNYESETSIAARRVSTTRRWLLSATPLENGVEDVVSLLRCVGFQGLPSNARFEQVVEALQGRFLRRRKRDVLPELPAIIDQTVRIGLSPAQSQEYAEAEAHLELGGNSVTDLLAAVTKLKQICNRASTGESTKLNLLLTLLDDSGRESQRFIIVSQYVQTLDFLEPRLATLATVHRLSGRDDSDARESAIQAFSDGPGPTVLLLSLKAGGVGLNIPAATHVVLFDRWWNPASEDQAVHRAHRFGRTTPLQAIRILTDDTVETRIDDILRQKARIFAEVIDGGTDGASFGGPRLTREELLTVLRGSRPNH